MELRPGYKQTEVGVIPEDWEVGPLGPHVEIKSGESPSLFRFLDEGTPYFKVEQLNNNSKKLRDTPYFIHTAKKIPSGSLIFPKRGASILLNKVRILAMDSYMDTNLMTLTPDQSLDPEFLYYALIYIELWRIADTTSIPQINNKHIAPLLLTFPPTKAEQEAIAEALSDADALIESLDQLITKKRHLKQGAMQELLTGKRRLPGFSGEWEMKRLGDVIEKFVGGGTPSRSNPTFWGEEIPWVTVKDFATFTPRYAQESITKLGLLSSASHLITKGTLITSTRMALGKAVIYEVDVAINQDLKALFPIAVLSANYLYFWFQYNGQAIDDLGSGSTVKGISLPDLKKIDFHLPSNSEQTAIATILSDMDTELAELELRLAKARHIKQGMMQELLTGRIRLL